MTELAECRVCDTARRILCIDCYHRAHDERLGPTYAEYVARAAGYTVRPSRRTRSSVALALVLTISAVFAASTASTTDERVQARLAAVHARSAKLNVTFERLREARNCLDQAIPSDVSAALERAARGEAVTGCRAFTRP